jgi:outer membrane protein assembly factor BamD
MKRSFTILPILFLLLFLGSCKFQQVLKKGDVDQKYEMAMKLYEKKDYSRALQLFDPLMNTMKATDKSQKLYYCYAYSYYYQKDYTLAAYYFKRYSSNFPNTKEAEECFFMSAYCNFLNAPEYQLDQTSSYDAMKELQLFTNTYPTSKRVSECNDLIDQIRTKLEFKDFKIAKLYYRMEDFTAALTCFNNILKDYTDTPHKEEILFLITKTYYKYAKQSIDIKKRERYQKTLTAAADLLNQYPQSRYLNEVNDIKARVAKDLELLKTQPINKISFNENINH